MMEYGLALGGGGTKGAYHLGVWHALQDLKINVTCITGTSIGAINGAIITQGDASDAIDLWKNISMSNVVDTEGLEDVSQNLFEMKNIIKVISAAHKNNGLETAPLRKLLESIIDEKKIRNSCIDFGLTTYSLDNFEETAIFIEDIPQGKLIDFLMASSSLPGLKSTTINDKKYIDGGITNNIPADMILEKGYKNIICVDVGGVGFVKELKNLGANIINIKCSENIIGLMDFNEKSISKMIKLGYYDTLKTFDYIKGIYYNFNISDYHKARIKYSEDIITGIENAAMMLEIDSLKIYRFDDLKDGVISACKKMLLRNIENNFQDGIMNDKFLFIKLVKYIMDKGLDPLTVKLIKGFKKNIYMAANAVVYFFKESE